MNMTELNISENWHYLNHAPHLPALYLQAACKRKITGSSLPEQGLSCRMSVQPKQLAAYRKVCGFADTALLPATYPHVLAFPLQMQLLTSKAFPFPLLGLIHLNNRIRILRTLGAITDLRIGVQVHNLQPHAKGAVFDLRTTADDALGPLWEASSRLLCLGVKLPGALISEPALAPDDLNEVSRWPAPSDIGRRYARVSGDYNPIHLSTPSAKLFGMPQAIAHGLWNKARTLAALGQHLPAANIEISVDFKKPVRLPGEVILSASEPGSSGDFRLASPDNLEHMVGRWRPIAP